MMLRTIALAVLFIVALPVAAAQLANNTTNDTVPGGPGPGTGDAADTNLGWLVLGLAAIVFVLVAVVHIAGRRERPPVH
ncbi:MAG: hypothetical protein ACT4PT_13605 [Methanobacteriota archaeon]